MQIIEPYIAHLELLAVQLPVAQIADYTLEVTHALNGELSKTLRELVAPADLQAAGAFFTGEPMADELVASIPADSLATITAFDPSCGGGNLLLAIARRFALAPTLIETIADWSERLYGMDIHPEFVRATRARLMLLVTLRGLTEAGPDFFNCQAPSLAASFPHLVAADSLQTTWPRVELYLLNPPFNKQIVPRWCKWATSKTSLAALFVSKCLIGAEPASLVRAILPDVLRSGSNYNKWRRHVQHLASIEAIDPLGQFDDDTNVDVFRLTLTTGGRLMEQPVIWVDNTPPAEITETIGDRYQISVGKVVPHRDPKEGPDYPYLDVHYVKPWATIVAGEARRQYPGTAFTPPFVVVRRNSRAKDSQRATGTIIAANSEQPEQVAVENHLLVLTPQNGTLAECEALLERLQNPATNEWLNTRIRCRHLTVGSVQSIPWWP
jgi:hypothetical protein